MSALLPRASYPVAHLPLRLLTILLLTFACSPRAARAGSGDFDPGFAGQGWTTLSAGARSPGYFWDVALQPDGKLVAVGEARRGLQGEFALARFLPDGSPDPAFGSGGALTTDLGSAFDVAYAVALQPDGKIVVAGTQANDSVDARVALARYTPSGALDHTFGAAGITTSDLGPGADAGFQLALQPDGKIVVVGMSGLAEAPNDLSNVSSFEHSTFTVLRYLPNGQLDPSFSSDGVAATPIRGLGHERAEDVIVLPDGKILVGGRAYDGDSAHFTLARYTSAGLLDDTFATHGVQLHAITLYGDAVEGLALLPGGEILAVGHNLQDSLTVVARYSADGLPDSSFGRGGVVTSNVLARSQGVVVAPDGSFAMTGWSTTRLSGSGDYVVGMALVWFTAAGDLRQPAQIKPYGTYPAEAQALALQPDGKVVVVGSRGSCDTCDFHDEKLPALMRFNADGTLDVSFDGDGMATSLLGHGEEAARVVALQPDGKLLVAGWRVVEHREVLLARYGADGALDPTFSGDGVAVAHLPVAWVEIHQIALQADGRILVVGDTWNYNEDHGRLVVLRFTPGGELDPEYGEDGVLQSPVLAGSLTAAAMQPDGKLVVAGYTGLYGAAHPWVARLLPDGTYDTAFGSGGMAIVNGVTGAVQVRALALQPDGRLLLAGSNKPRWDLPKGLLLARLTGDGKLDTSFHGGVRLDLTGAEESEARAVAVQADGSIVVVGSVGAAGAQDLLVARLTLNGEDDLSFGGDGSVTLDVGAGDDVGGAVLVQPDEKLVVGGGGAGFNLLRLLPDGSPDLAFGAQGRAHGSLHGGAGLVSALAILADGRLVAAGQAASTLNGDSDLFLARILNSAPAAPATLRLNYATARPGSTLTLMGSHFAPGGSVTLLVNGVVIADEVRAGADGSVVVLLATGEAISGHYTVSMVDSTLAPALEAALPSASASFTLAQDAPLRSPEGFGTLLQLPIGSLEYKVYLPLSVRP